MLTKRGNIEILFNSIQPEIVLNNIKNFGSFISKDLIDFNLFYHCSIENFENYSKNEIEKVYISLKKEIDFNNPSSFFKYLGEFSSSLLIYNEYEPIVDYSKLMRWNKVSHKLGQDLLTMSYLAYHDYKYNDETEFFAYKSIISTNNRQLHNILEQGTAENHFHLKGSAQVFILNWLSLMNHPFNRKKEFEKISKKLNPYENYSNLDKIDFYTLVKVAAIIRAYFFEKSYKKTIENKILNLDEIWHSIISLDVTDLKKCLQKIEIIKSNLSFNTQKDLDYAIYMCYQNINKTKNYMLTGERKILYSTIYLMMDEQLNELESKLFYLYILIKNKFRREIIQVNNLYGFSNFSDYEIRKELFIKHKKYSDTLYTMAIENTFEDQNLISLELRITPKNKVQDNINYIKMIDSLCPIRKNETFFVYHFIKIKEDNKFSLGNHYVECRNFRVRNRITQQAKCLALSLKKSVSFRNRIKGIDACNNEYHCRPEVFGQVFRFLSNFHIKTHPLKSQIPVEIFKTYHAGEDFFDIIDGLRAIDEAILFCNMSNGSRIGHATVLGLDVNQYYNRKDRIIMTKQDFLDNYSWIYNKSIEYGIDKSDYPCFNILEKLFYNILDEVYGLYAKGTTCDEYFQAWKLRGDNPNRYSSDGLIEIENYITTFDYYEMNTWVKNEDRTEYTSKLYYAYHFNTLVREIGQEQFDMKITNDYVELVQKIQKLMQFELARKGIFIECNPTSNYYISKLKRYENHPILKFYNDDLTHGNDRNCAQLNVSINTDDQGVFDTSLENEYALMAYSLENLRDKNGIKYTPNEVYNWIDSIRKMSIQQKFSKISNK